MSWPGYVGRQPRVVPESKFGLAEVRFIEEAAAGLRASFHAAHDWPGACALIRSSRPELRCLIGRDLSLMLVSGDASTLYGGIFRGTTFIVPEYRGQGLSKEIHLSIDGVHRDWLAPSHYSEGGFRARQGAHRVATERAIAEGLTDIHPDNIARYACPALLDDEPSELDGEAPVVFGR